MSGILQLLFMQETRFGSEQACIGALSTKILTNNIRFPNN
jgi:DNA-binding HxlR family transcriptional regulator